MRRNWTIFWIIIIACLLLGCLYRLNSIYNLIDWLVNIYFPKFEMKNLWACLMVSSTFLFGLIGFIFLKAALKELSRYKLQWVRRYKVAKSIINYAIIPYSVFQIIYSPIREFDLDFGRIIKIILILAQVCLILYAIYRSIGTDNELYMKE